MLGKNVKIDIIIIHINKNVYIYRYINIQRAERVAKLLGRFLLNLDHFSSSSEIPPLAFLTISLCAFVLPVQLDCKLLSDSTTL